MFVVISHRMEPGYSWGLKPDRENVTREALLFSTNATSRDWKRVSPSAQLLLLRNDATVVGCTEVLFQPSFFLCCLWNMRRTMRLLPYGMGVQSTMRITKPDTAQSERALVIDTSSLKPSVSSQKRVAHVIHVLTASHPVLSCWCCTHTTTRFRPKINSNDFGVFWN